MPFKINLLELETSWQIIEAEKRAVDSLNTLPDPILNMDKEKAIEVLKNPQIFGIDEQHSYWPILSFRLNALISQPCSVDVVSDLWSLSLSPETFVRDLEALASRFNDKKMFLRKNPAIARDLSTGAISAKYIDPNQLYKLLPIVADLFNNPCTKHPFLSSLISWVYLYRLHPFEDGNGRLSRHITNFALRNFGVLKRPIIFPTISLFLNMREITPLFHRADIEIEALLLKMYECCFQTLSIDIARRK